MDKDGNNLAFYWFNSYKELPQGGRPGGQSTVAPGDEFKEKLTILKASGLDVVTPQKNGSTLYHLAVAKENVKLIQTANKLGVDINFL